MVLIYHSDPTKVLLRFLVPVMILVSMLQMIGQKQTFKEIQPIIVLLEQTVMIVVIEIVTKYH